MEQRRRHKAVSSKNVRYYYLLALIPFLFLIVMYELLPLIMLVVDSLKSEQSKDILFTLENYQKIFSTLSYQKAIANSLRITSVSTAFGIVIAFLGARAAYNSRGKFRNVYLTVLNMTSNFAGVPLAFAYMIILGNAGVIKQIANMYGIGFLQDFDLYSSTGLTMIYVNAFTDTGLQRHPQRVGRSQYAAGRNQRALLAARGYSRAAAQPVFHAERIVCQCFERVRDRLRAADEQLLPPADQHFRFLCG